uniref:limulus clotting factor C n=1 Tax=Anopheles farauti TaxID=69004 RepID=A0A182Q1Z6_9DIPT
MAYGKMSLYRSGLSLLILLMLSFESAQAIVGGEVTDIDEFPWTALIEHEVSDGTFRYGCAGSLITERYVLTAATCVIPMSNQKITRVRLGAWNLNRTREYECFPASIDVDIESTIVHANYNRRSRLHDIALVRLARDVRFSAMIRPIEMSETKSVEGTAVAAGWGRTEHNTVAEKKLKVQLDIVSMEQCAPIYNDSRLELKQSHLCAGGQDGKDTCMGDMGGPLMQERFGKWYLVGIVSFGRAECGQDGFPGVYTNVVEYLDWVKERIIT